LLCRPCLHREGLSAQPANPMAPAQGHFPAKAKNVIYLFMMGGPSHLDLFDEKPNLRKFDGQPIPESYIEGERFEQIKEAQPSVLGSPYRFSRQGETGTNVSELLPYTKDIVDDLGFLRAVHTDETVHPLA